ncbi:MAG TPA: prefoldin subunit alpha [Candidatus Nanoarchaeia archaeon]|nr:prefoldin subunit alpha [Candidatus Nanoarchaeia archaeon]
MADEKKIEDKYLQLQMLQQQAEQITEYVEKLQMQQKEVDTSIEALTELQKTNLNTEILAPLANGIFLKAELKDNQKLVVNVGADVSTEKTIPEVIQLLEEQKEKIAENLSEAETVLQQLHEHGRKTYPETEEIE